MPNPKHKHSKARSRSQAAHFKVTAPNLSPCPRCHRLRPSHRVCPNCGHYREREVVKLEEA
jgi:large subunit ribosomal protein L32